MGVKPPRCQTAGLIRENANPCTTSAKLLNLEFILILKQLFIDCSWIDINTGVLLREMLCSDRCKTMAVDRKYRKGLALPCLMSEPLPNAANSSDVFRLDSMLRELRKLLCYDKHGCFSWESVFGPPQKPWLRTDKNQKALALLGLASGPLPNAVNSSTVLTELAAEPTTKTANLVT